MNIESTLTEDIFSSTDDMSSGVKVIDFGNAIHCVYDELSLYYDDFELQTLLYRAPEVSWRGQFCDRM